MIPILCVIFGIFNVREAFSNFAHPILFLFLGGFALATALQKQKLDRAIAAWAVGIAKGRFLLTTILLFLVAAFISMWISNTATVAMMLPITYERGQG